MAGRNANKTEEQNDLQSENKQLQDELNNLKALVEQLLSANQAQSSINKEVDNQEVDEEFVTIPHNKMTNITSLFYGGMTLQGANRPIRFEKFGVTRPVTFEDLNAICNNHRNLAESGGFFIHNRDMVKALYLEDEYKKFLNKETIESFITLPDEKISSMFKNTTRAIQQTIVDIVIDGVLKNILGENNKYNNRNKIELISELSGKNIYKIANDLANQDK